MRFAGGLNSRRFYADGGKLGDILNAFRRLEYRDPAADLRSLREVERWMVGKGGDPKVRTLRTAGLKPYREWRDAALFCYGMGQVYGVPILYAPTEHSDYDFVATWVEDQTQNYCPVQLKELVPAELNPNASASDILKAVREKYTPSDTVLAVNLNREGRFDFSELSFDGMPFREVWFFWAAAPGGNEWAIQGDMLGKPTRKLFTYPNGDEEMKKAR